MKHVFWILLFSVLSIFGLRPAQAQWEQIGWQGGTIYPSGQLGNTLFGFGYNSVYKSTDWGKTWTIFRKGLPLSTLIYNYYGLTKQGNYLNFSYLNVSADSIFGSGFYYCRENDSSWSFKKLSLIKGIRPQTLFWSGDTVFAFRQKKLQAIDADDGFYLSIDGGNTWQLRQTPVPLDKYVFTFSAGTHFLFGINNNISYYRTDNFGESWKRLRLPNGDSLSFNISFPTDSDAIIQLFKDPNNPPYFYHSTDIGDTWNVSQISLPAGTFVSGLPLCKIVGDRLFIAVNRLYVSNDRGGHFHSIFSSDTTLGVDDILGNTNYYILRTVVNGNFTTDSNFRTLSPLLISGVLSNYRSLTCVYGTRLFALDISKSTNWFYDSMFVSSDNGSTWAQRQFYDRNKLYNHCWIQDGSNLYASGIEKDSFPCIFRSTDEGNTWEITTKLSSKDAIGQFFVEGDTIVVRRQNDFLMTVDKGKSWIIVTSPFIESSVNMAYRKGIFDLFYSYQSTLITSVDFGKTWVQEDQIPFGSNSFGPYIYADRCFISNGSQLSYQLREESTWKKCSGLSTSVAYLPNADGDGFLYATYQNFYHGQPSLEGHTALYYSLDSGSNWKQLGDYVTNSPDVFIGSDYLFLAGPTELWRGPKPRVPSSVSQATTSSSISIGECYPNPASSELQISYAIPKHSNVILRVFDITGKEITSLVTNELDMGSYNTVWDTRALPNGSYILKLAACGQSATKVVEVVK